FEAIQPRIENWLEKIEDWMGFPGKFTVWKGVKIHDLSNGNEVGCIEKAQSPSFCADGKALGVVIGKEIHLYRLPLSRSWVKFLGYFFVFGGIALSICLFLDRKKTEGKQTAQSPELGQARGKKGSG